MMFRQVVRLLGLVGALSMLAPAAHAASYTVTSLADSGSGSLRATIAAAAAGDSINITAAGTLTLTSGEIPVTKSLSISGPGISALTISGNGASRIFKISVTTAGAADAAVALSGMTLANGYATGTCPAPTTGSGGAIAATESLTLTNVVITGSTATRNGGGIAWAMRRSGQQLVLNNVQLTNNAAGCAAATAGGNGGAVFAGYDSTAAAGATGSVTLTGTTIQGNTARRNGGGVALAGSVALTASATRFVSNAASAAFGGALYLAPPAVSTLVTPSAALTGVEITGNTAALAGGAIAAVNAATSLQAAGNRSALVLTNSTLSGNSVSGSTADGAAVNLAGNVSLALNNSTVAFNSLSAASSGTALSRSVCSGSVEPTAALLSSIVAQTNNAAPGFADLGDGGASLTQPWSASNSLWQSASATVGGSGNLTSVDPQLVGLAWNGGTTRTHALLSTSAAINAGSNTLALATDQRGTSRVYGAAADIGALESPFAAASACSFDVDGDGVIAAATDGALIARIATGYTGASALSGAVSASATRSTWAALDSYLTSCGYRSTASACSFDLDGDGQITATGDGVLLTRVLQGGNSDAALTNAANPSGSRRSWNTLKTYLNANCGFALQ